MLTERSSFGYFFSTPQRLVHLATLRETALAQLGHLDAVKVALTEQKATQQGRLLAALDARLAAAFAAVDPHRCVRPSGAVVVILCLLLTSQHTPQGIKGGVVSGLGTHASVAAAGWLLGTVAAVALL